jgi:hypothetical protein
MMGCTVAVNSRVETWCPVLKMLLPRDGESDEFTNVLGVQAVKTVESEVLLLRLLDDLLGHSTSELAQW